MFPSPKGQDLLSFLHLSSPFQVAGSSSSTRNKSNNKKQKLFTTNDGTNDTNNDTNNNTCTTPDEKSTRSTEINSKQSVTSTPRQQVEWHENCIYSSRSGGGGGGENNNNKTEWILDGIGVVDWTIKSKLTLQFQSSSSSPSQRLTSPINNASFQSMPIQQQAMIHFCSYKPFETTTSYDTMVSPEVLFRASFYHWQYPSRTIVVDSNNNNNNTKSNRHYNENTDKSNNNILE